MTPEETTQKIALAKAQALQIMALMNSIAAIQKELPEKDNIILVAALNEIICTN